MKKILNLIVFIIFITTLTACGQKQAIVSEWEWVTQEGYLLPNFEGNQYIFTEVGDNCGLQFGGHMFVIDEYDDSLYLCYYDSNGMKTSGTPCNDNVLFLYPKDKFHSSTEKYDSILYIKTNKRLKIENILKNEKNN